MFNNKTRNQHYISQVEQKLNSIDPSIDKKKRRIYKFESLNRELQEYKLCVENSVKIEQNLTFNDLYSLEIFDDGTRDNFEKYFCQLEEKVEVLTKEVLASEKLDKDIFLTLFNAKLMNVIRNPYCILSTLNTYSSLCNYTPINQNLAYQFEKINTLAVPESILSEFRINQVQFRQWLKIIFYMVVPMKLDNGNYLNLATEIIKNIFDPAKMHLYIALATHENEICLLSDRAHVDFSEALPGNNFGYEFNLTKNAFIHFTFAENNLENLSKLANIPENLMTRMKERGLNKLEMSSLKIDKFVNEDILFRAYNSRVIYQCHTHFYAADIVFKK
ncbi:hypothetical protein [Acinetobacter sp.]|uniref:hypothetical protein n=1 Tax=Acinetobacter sp. TaxID=472 RepID=UPI003BB072D4